jgi:hypothetical protein
LAKRRNDPQEHVEDGPGLETFPAPAPVAEARGHAPLEQAFRVEAGAGEVVPNRGRLIPADDAPSSVWPTNLDLNSWEGNSMLLAALGEGDVQVADLHGAPFPTRWYLVTPGERIDPETGEVSNFPRLVLISPEGKTLVTTSTVVPHRMAAVLERWGPGPWDPPLPLVVIERRARRTGRTYHELRMGSQPEGGAR